MSIRETITVQRDADLRRDAGESAFTIEEIVTQFQLWKSPSPVYALVDPYDLYLWRALDASTQSTIDLINGQAVTP